jgi:hypothetical protein
MGLERGPLSLVSTIEELLEIEGSGTGLENRDYSSRRSAALTSRHPQTLALTSPKSDGRSAGIVHSQTKAMELVSLSSQTNRSYLLFRI